ncbi:zinc-ribbon domain-containing protein [Lentisphaerota bacterium WC36G]|nr:zinc-ribbon domain-containing protein [Lentisphaerae bacterium WC36]
MADISINCSNCNTEYEVPEEMIGQDVECSECGSVFTVALPEQAEESADGSTNTVKISRSGIGMVPQLEDDFVVNLVDEENTAPKVNLDAKTPSQSANDAPADKGKGWKFWKK